MGIQEKIKQIKDEMARTQKNKATEYHLGTLKAKLAKLRTQMFEEEKKSKEGPKGEGFDVPRVGNARVAMVGFPSVGKSSLLNSLTTTQSTTAEYQFTTLTCIPGMLYIKETKIQLLDMPGIIEGASQGKGRGRQVIAVAKGADMVLMILDAQNWREEKARLMEELETVGIRLNKPRPDIVITKRATGGVSLNGILRLTKVNHKMVENVMKEYKHHNCDVLMRGDYDIDQLIDIIEGNRIYMKCLYIYNKIDTISIKEVDKLAKLPFSLPLSCELKLGFDLLLNMIWTHLDLVRIYTKKRGQPPDFQTPIILTQGRGGLSVHAALNHIHKDFVKDFKFAFVWGKSVKYSPQRCGLQHILADEDVLQTFKKSKN